jgi:fatty-acid desaturase
MTTFFMVVFHLGAVAALFVFTWKAFLVGMFLWWIAGGIGIAIGCHRLLTHPGYRTPNVRFVAISTGDTSRNNFSGSIVDLRRRLA